jgi:hypothetical protein
VPSAISCCRPATSVFRSHRVMSKLISSATAIPGNVQAYIFDRLLGKSTSEPLVTRDSIFAVGGDNCAYSGSQWLPVRRALRDLAPGPNDVFGDLGSGKGKALLIAGRLAVHLGYIRPAGTYPSTWPDRNASSPARTACLIEAASSAGLVARTSAVLTSTAAAPSSVVRRSSRSRSARSDFFWP